MKICRECKAPVATVQPGKPNAGKYPEKCGGCDSPCWLDVGRGGGPAREMLLDEVGDPDPVLLWQDHPKAPTLRFVAVWDEENGRPELIIEHVARRDALGKANWEVVNDIPRAMKVINRIVREVLSGVAGGRVPAWAGDLVVV